MEEAKSYKTAGAFRTALENRLQARARDEGTDLQRLRRQVAFDRFLARMFSKGPKAAYPWVLKGGYAMELRVQSARTTKDLDLTLTVRICRRTRKHAARKSALCCKNLRRSGSTIISNSLSGKREKIWMARPKEAAAIRSRHKWMGGILRAFLWTLGSETT